MWEQDQKDEQILRIRSQIGYQHNKDLERIRKKIRQTPPLVQVASICHLVRHTYKGLETKRKEWTPEPGPPSDETAFA